MCERMAPHRVERCAVVLAAAFLLVLAVECTATAEPWEQKVHPLLLERTSADHARDDEPPGTTDFFVRFHSGAADLSHIPEHASDRRRLVYEALHKHARSSQAKVVAELEDASVEYDVLTVVNRVIVRAADRALLQRVAMIQETSELSPNWEFHVDMGDFERDTEASPATAPDSAAFRERKQQRGAEPEYEPAYLARIGVDELHANGVLGEGTTVGVISTGYQWWDPNGEFVNGGGYGTDEYTVFLKASTLTRDTYRGYNVVTGEVNHNHNWFEPYDSSAMEPSDSFAIGSAITGVAVGDLDKWRAGTLNETRNGEPVEELQAMGVATRAQHIHCRGISLSGFGTELGYLRCLDFMLAPFNLQGNHARPDLGVDVIVLGFVCTACPLDTFDEAAATLNAAGVVVVGQTGVLNHDGGDPCGSAGGTPEVLTQAMIVGGFREAESDYLQPNSPPNEDAVWYYNRFGPHAARPNVNIIDLLAPAANIWFAFVRVAPHVPKDETYDSPYQLTGTSFSAAMVGGLSLMAIGSNTLVRHHPDIIYGAAFYSAQRLPDIPSFACGGDYVNGPNQDWGYGLVDGVAFVNTVRAYGALEGIVVRERVPVEGARVKATRVASGDAKREPEAITDLLEFYNDARATSGADGSWRLVLYEGVWRITYAFEFDSPIGRLSDVIEQEVTIIGREATSTSVALPGDPSTCLLRCLGNAIGGDRCI